MRYILDPNQSDGWLRVALRRWKYRLVFSALMLLRPPLWALGYAFDFTDVFDDPNAQGFAWSLIPYNVTEDEQESIHQPRNDVRTVN